MESLDRGVSLQALRMGFPPPAMDSHTGPHWPAPSSATLGTVADLYPQGVLPILCPQALLTTSLLFLSVDLPGVGGVTCGGAVCVWLPSLCRFIHSYGICQYFSLKLTLVRYNSHAIKDTHFKSAVPGILSLKSHVSTTPASLQSMSVTPKPPPVLSQ